MHNRTPPVIAIIGSDGSGKSTVSEHIAQWMEQFGKTAPVHLGKQSGNVGRSLANLPVVGKMLGKSLNKQTDKANKKLGEGKQPSLFAALVISAFTIRRIRRFKRMLQLRKEGYIILADRFPQADIHKAFDGPGFSDGNEGSCLVKRLANREKRVFKWMASFKPDLVIKLHVDLETALARKPDHSPESLKRKIDVTPRLTYAGAPTVDVDTNRPLDEVLADVKASITKLMMARGYPTPKESDQ